MRCLVRLPLLLLFLLLASTAHAWPGAVLEVIDGDTITVAPMGQEDSPIRVRLYGIDAPESAQAYGPESTERLRALLPIGETAMIIPMTTDKYGRTVGLVIHQGATVNLRMVEQGAAWIYPRFCRAYFCRDWMNKAKEARASGRGLWEAEAAGEKATPPWEWRRGVGAASSEKGGL